MAENKTSFILYGSQRGIFEKLNNEQAGVLIKHIFAYVNDENPEGDFVTDLAFEAIMQQMKRDLKKWEKTREGRSSAGKASAEARRVIREKGLADVKSVKVKPTKPEDVPVVFSYKKAFLEYGFDKPIVDQYMQVRKDTRATNSEIAFKSFIKVIEMCNGVDKNIILAKCVEKNWRGLEYDWLVKIGLVKKAKWQSPA